VSDREIAQVSARLADTVWPGCDNAKTLLEWAPALVADEVTINPPTIATFAARLREALHTGETTARKMWLASIVDRIIVGHKTIRIIGRTDNFERGLKNHEKGSPPVRSSVQEWCATQSVANRSGLYLPC
jgi:hypothetical protein